MSVINIKLTLNKHIIDSNRYEEYIWFNNKCYSLFKDGPRNYSVNIDGGSYYNSAISTKKDALKILANHMEGLNG